MSAQVFASQLVANLAALGVKQFFLSPGARSQALALAAKSLDSAGVAKLLVRLDERSMAFSALGASLASGEPVALITTSGTAVANLHPAVLEAHHSGVPLILLTADRPASLRGKGANQTTNQVGIFADAVYACIDANQDQDAGELAKQAVAMALSKKGPVQLNLQFSEPLSSLSPTASEIYFSLAKTEVKISTKQPVEARLEAAEGTVVIAGAGATASAAGFANLYQLPLFAEPASGARFGDCVITGYVELLGTEIAKNITQAIVFGKPTLSRAITKLLQSTSVKVQVVTSQTHGHFNIGSNAQNQADVYSFSEKAKSDWLKSWKDANQQLSKTLELDRKNIVLCIWEATKQADSILIGASAISRDADRYAPAKEVRAFSNRGLSGIDGTISTAIGISINTTGKTRVLIGDLTFIHDISALNTTSIAGLNLQLIVVNDHGGKIFERLEIAQLANPTDFEELFKTPQNVDLEQVSRAFGWNYLKCENLANLEKGLELPGLWVIEVPLG